MPAGASVAGDGENWNWVSSNPAPFSGSMAHQSNIVSGLHQHYFYGATATLNVNAGDKLTAYVYLDPSNMPSQIMLQWNDGSWEHRAYWGANNLPWGTDGTNSRRYMGPLPAAGTWVKLEVPASLVGLEGHTLNGMAFSMWGGRATWDRAGKTSSSVQWLVTDHLGTPRMIIDQTGTLANIKRHDYLPFGEELFAGSGGRSVGMGYASGDSVRQQFTGKERDVETGLDYFLARYYSSIQGRFTGVDSGPFAVADPQNFNRYSYVQNNPLKFIDPTGEELVLLGDDAEYIKAELERKTGYKLIRDPKTGVVTIDKSVKRTTGEEVSNTLAGKLEEVIRLQDAKKNSVTVTINTTKDEKGEIFVDDFKTRSLDVSDYSILNKADPKFGSTLLGHVLRRNINKQPPPSKISLERSSLTPAIIVALLLRAGYSRIIRRRPKSSGMR